MAKMEFGELDQYLFGQATHYDIYKKLGAHPVTQNGKSGTYFAVWAPNAEDVSVVGELMTGSGTSPDEKDRTDRCLGDFLLQEQKWEICINSVSVPWTEGCCIKPILMQIGPRCARAMHPVSRISQVSNGGMPHG